MSGFFSGENQEEIAFDDYTTKSPMFCRDVSLMGAVFTADLGAIQDLLPGDYRPIRIAPGRGLAAIHCIEYHDTDMGPYNEVALSLMIHPGGGRLPGPLQVAMYTARESYHAYVQELPVNTEISVQGGQRVFNYPKYLAHISFSETATRRACTVRDSRTSALILEVACDRLRTRARPKLITLNNYPLIGGVPHRARMLVNLREFSVAYLRPHARVQPGDDVRGLPFTRIGLGRSVHYIYAPRCEAILFPPRPAGEARRSE